MLYEMGEPTKNLFPGRNPTVIYKIVTKSPCRRAKVKLHDIQGLARCHDGAGKEPDQRYRIAENAGGSEELRSISPRMATRYSDVIVVGLRLRRPGFWNATGLGFRPTKEPTIITTARSPL